MSLNVTKTTEVRVSIAERCQDEHPGSTCAMSKGIFIDPAEVFPESISQRLVVSPTGCWEWTGAQHPLGYGVVKVAGKQWAVHRYVSTLIDGKIPAGMHVLHRCDNRACVNPAHLFRGTHSDNMADKQQKGRTVSPATKLSAEQVQEIRARYQAGGVSYRTLAAKYGVSKETIGAVVRRETWQEK